MGGVRVSVDGEPLTRYLHKSHGDALLYVAHDAEGAEHDHPPNEFAGEYLGQTITSLYDAFEPFLDGTAERHREYTAELWSQPGPASLGLSWLDADHVRVAILPRSPTGSVPTGNARFPLASLTGAVTTPTAFASALADLFEACSEYSRRAFAEYGDRPEDFEQKADDLVAYYEDYITRLREFCADDDTPIDRRSVNRTRWLEFPGLPVSKLKTVLGNADPPVPRVGVTAYELVAMAELVEAYGDRDPAWFLRTLRQDAAAFGVAPEDVAAVEEDPTSWPERGVELSAEETEALASLCGEVAAAATEHDADGQAVGRLAEFDDYLSRAVRHEVVPRLHRE